MHDISSHISTWKFVQMQMSRSPPKLKLYEHHKSGMCLIKLFNELCMQFTVEMHMTVVNFDS